MGSGAPFVAAPADQATSDWRDAVDLAARVIADHPEVVSVSMPRPNADGTRLIVEAEIEVPLPLKWAASGASPNGVRADEPVTFSFSPGYPFLAPEVTLRDDFDRSLAHVMPGPAEGPVVPCLYEGRLSELMHNRGLPALVDHLVEWLVRAAIERRTCRGRRLAPAAFERFFQWEYVCRRMADLADSGVRRIALADLGKNVLAYQRAARANSIDVLAIGDDRFAQPARRYRGIPLVTVESALRLDVEAIVVANTSPVHGASTLERITRRTSVPVHHWFGRTSGEEASLRRVPGRRPGVEQTESLYAFAN